MQPSNLTYRDLILNLIRENKTLCDLFGSEQKYKKLLQELKKYDIEDEDPLPYQKDLLKALGITRTKLMRLMHGLYQDFKTRLFNPNAYPTYDTEVWLYVKARNEYWPIGVGQLSFLPREGEEFTVGFIGEIWDARGLIVESVTQELENGIHKIHINLDQPSY